MSIASPATRYTPDDLLRMPDGKRFELIDGQLVKQNVSMFSSFVAGKIFGQLERFVELKNLGMVFPEGTSYQAFPGDPEKVRRADASFIKAARLSSDVVNTAGHSPIAPDLAVEVVSPNDLTYDVDGKVADYLKAGVALVWVINPKTKTLQVHRPRVMGKILHESDELDGEDVLPVFAAGWPICSSCRAA